MSKGLGQKIVVKFTEDLVGDVTGYPPANIAEDFSLPTGIVSASSQYSSYSPDRAFMADDQYWYTRTFPAWIQIGLDKPVHTAGFRWDTRTTSYRPRDFTVQGSNDGEEWENIYTGTSDNISNWKEFRWEPSGAYQFYRWDISSTWSSYLYIYQIEILLALGNEGAFTVTGKEYKYVNGPLIDGDYQIQFIERYDLPIWTIDISKGSSDGVIVGADGIVLGVDET